MLPLLARRIVVFVDARDNCQNALDDHLSGQKWVKMEENYTLFHRKRNGGE